MTLTPTTLSDYLELTGDESTVTRVECIEVDSPIIAELKIHKSTMQRLIYHRGWYMDGNNELLLAFTLSRNGVENIRNVNEIKVHERIRKAHT